jgi:threonine dehydratase
VLVPPFDDPLVIAGQGTAGREIVEDLTALGSSLTWWWSAPRAAA